MVRSYSGEGGWALLEKRETAGAHVVTGRGNAKEKQLQKDANRTLGLIHLAKLPFVNSWREGGVVKYSKGAARVGLIGNLALATF